jgi:hypothetical protein
MSTATTAMAAATTVTVNSHREEQESDAAEPHERATGRVKMIQEFRE